MFIVFLTETEHEAIALRDELPQTRYEDELFILVFSKYTHLVGIRHGSERPHIIVKMYKIKTQQDKNWHRYCVLPMATKDTVFIEVEK
jgi:hypothetical protein